MSRRQKFLQQLTIATAVTAGLVATSSVQAATTMEKALSMKPIHSDVNYEQVSAEDAENCKLRDIERDDWAGWEVVSPDGQLLRRFADTNDDAKVDMWCYFRYGVEVYRDIDSDFNGKADQYRWLGTEGTRWGLDKDEDTQIDGWKQISAEEVSAELVKAIRDADAGRFVNLLASERDLRGIGLGKAKARMLAEKALDAAKKFKRLASSQSAIGKSAEWLQFTAGAPGVVPAGKDDSTEDVTVYENAVAMYESDGKSGQLMAGTMIKIGDTWKLIELPSVSESGDAITQTVGNFFRPGMGDVAVSKAAVSGSEMQNLVKSLEQIDTALATETSKKKVAGLHADRADLVERLIASTDDSNERITWIRQLVDTVSFAVQSDAYPDGLDRLKAARTKYARRDKAVAAYIDYAVLSTDYASRLTPEADSVKVQEWYLDRLTKFVSTYPKADESAQALLQLALGKEFENNEKEALTYYKKIVADFRGNEAANKATGAIRRLDSIGRRVELEGRTIDGKAFRLSALKGRPVVIQYWATWCEPCKEDMKQLRRLQAQYKKAGLTIVGVSVDNSRENAVAFTKANAMPWYNLFEEGGMDGSPLSQQFGVQTLPTMMLVDKDGELVRHNVTVAELPGELDKLTR